MKEIISISNQIIKDTVKLHQKKYREKYILIEGEKSIYEAISAKLKIKYIFCKKENKDFQNFETYIVSDAILKKISTTESPSNIIAVVEKPKYNIEDFKKFKKIILLDSIKDPGNLGTIIRAAAAFKVDGILLFSDTVDEFSPKTIRSATGNMFKIPVLKINLNKLKEFKKTHKFLATVCHSDNFFDDYQLKENIILMFGSEADGLCEELLTISDEKITIKLGNNVESLNLAMSAVIFLYELQKKF